jgi:hypothetical protein
MPLPSLEHVASRLSEHARQRLNADAYSDCTHRFDLFACRECGSQLLKPSIERHASDAPGDFHGILSITCAACGARGDAVGITQRDDHVASIELPRCACGCDTFYLGICERWEDWGFFDEGTVSAMCSYCGRLLTLIDTD